MKPSEILAIKANEQAQAVYEQGRLAMEANDAQRAKALFESALAIHPNNFDAIHFLGILHAQTGLSQQALPFFKRAIELDPKMAAVYNNMALTLDNLKRYEEAIASFDLALALAPDYEQARVNRQNTLAKQNIQIAEKTA